jgi:hypothetical protein
MKTTRRNKKQKYSKNKTYRLLGGKLSKVNDDNTYERIMDKVKNERNNNFNLGNMPILKKTTGLAEGLLLKGIEHTGKLFDIDLSDSEDVSEKLDKIKIALADPKNKEKIRIIMSEAAAVGAIALEAAAPFIQPFVNKTIEVGSDAVSKVGKSVVKIGLNTAEEIPVIGVVIAIIRSLSNAGEAFLATTNAASQIVTSTSDSVNAATKNFDRLVKEKMQGINRINTSMNQFQRPIKRLSKISKLR